MRTGNAKGINVRKCFIYIISVAIFGAVLTVFSNSLPKKLDADEYYVYPMNSSCEEWENLTIKEKYEACRIPKRIVKNMSDEQLIQAILDYPFVHDIYIVSTSVEDGVILFKETSDAYAELIQRETGKESLEAVQRKMFASLSENLTAEKEFEYDVISDLILYFGK